MMERLGQLYPREDYRELNHRCGGLLQILGREFGQAARIYSILWLYPDDEAKRSVDKLTGPWRCAWIGWIHKDWADVSKTCQLYIHHLPKYTMILIAILEL